MLELFRKSNSAAFYSGNLIYFTLLQRFFGWVAGKAEGFGDWFTNKGWVDKERWDGLKGTLSDAGVQVVLQILSMFYLMMYGNPKTMTEFDVRDFRRELIKGDLSVVLDYFIAYSISEKLGNMVV